MKRKYDLSILIPARNEMFLPNTVNDIIENMRANTEVVVVLDGSWPESGISHHDRVNVVYLPVPVGQRAATNIAADIAQGEYFMKLDAHCMFDEGFDQKLLQDMQYDWTMVPTMKNLHAFDWVCEDCDNKTYQGPEPEKCEGCGGEVFVRELVWKPKKKTPNSTAYRFNKELEFKYFPELKRRQKGDLVETMSLQGSCFMVHRDKYFDLNLCDETWGSWGGQGAEVAIKTWLSGGKVICSRKTWYAHLFRTKSGFSFPYPNPGRDQKKAKNTLRDIFLNDKWEHAIYPLSWLVKKFEPIPDWHDDKPVKKKDN